MGGAIKIGRLSGIDVKVHRTFFAFIGYRASGSLAGALPVTENGGPVGMLTIEDFGTPDCSASQREVRRDG